MIDHIFVNYHSVHWLKTQSKIFQLCNPEHNYRIIVADGTGTDKERDSLGKLKDEGFIDSLVLYRAIEKDFSRGIDGSAQHAQGINIAMQEVKNNIFCVQDPDFFWVGKGFCRIAEEVLGRPGMMMFGAGHEITTQMPPYAKLRLRLRNLLAPFFAKPHRNDFRTPFFCGTFCKRQMVRDNKLTFDFDPGIWRQTGYDVAYQISQFVERYYPKGYLTLKPIPIDQFRRGHISAYGYLYRGKDFGLHMRHGTVDEEQLKSRELHEQTQALSDSFMLYAEKLAAASAFSV
jgi:hypothetical protein